MELSRQTLATAGPNHRPNPNPTHMAKFSSPDILSYPHLILWSRFKFGFRGSVKRLPGTSAATEARYSSSSTLVALDFQEQMLRNALNLSVP